MPFTSLLRNLHPSVKYDSSIHRKESLLCWPSNTVQRRNSDKRITFTTSKVLKPCEGFQSLGEAYKSVQFYSSFQLRLLHLQSIKNDFIIFFKIQAGFSKGDFLKTSNKMKNLSQLAFITLRNKLQTCYFSVRTPPHFISNFILKKLKTINIYGFLP